MNISKVQGGNVIALGMDLLLLFSRGFSVVVSVFVLVHFGGIWRGLKYLYFGGIWRTLTELDGSPKRETSPKTATRVFTKTPQNQIGVYLWFWGGNGCAPRKYFLQYHFCYLAPPVPCTCFADLWSKNGHRLGIQIFTDRSQSLAPGLS